MKRILSSVLCLVFAMIMLASCGKTDIGAYLPFYDVPKTEETLRVDLYIIYEEGTHENAITTVRQRIADYTLRQYNTNVNVCYFTADEYEAAVKEGIKYTAKDRADIILVNSSSLMDYLLDGSYLADLTEFFEGTTYGTLNASIATSVLDAYAVNGKQYCVPNNRVVGRYEYLLINRDMAEYFHVGSQAKLDSFTTEESVADLKALVQARIDNGEVEGTIDNYICVKEGMYEDKSAWEAKGYACNVISKPEANLTEDFSAFAILEDTYNVERAMEIVFALNNDKTLHNYLQYGIEATNYNVEEDEDGNNFVTRKEKGSHAAYYMNPLYTGDIFTSYYCEELGWDKDAAIYGDLQNKDSIYVAVED